MPPTGDTIWVGPGHYGDVNGDGTFSGPGDEQPNPDAHGEAAERGCIVCINKALRIYSTDGAARTIIEANASSGFGSTVMILHDGGDFGAEEHGFTITGGNTYGVMINLAYDRTPSPTFNNPDNGIHLDMTVKGNIDIGDATGFAMHGRDYLIKSCLPSPYYCQFVARILIASNRAINDTTGFEIISNFWGYSSGQIVVRDNEALGAGTGFVVYPGYVFQFAEPPAGSVQLVNNIAAHGGTGFYAALPGPVTYNTALDNSQSGFTVTPGGGPFTHNSAIGNGGPGLLIQASPDAFTVDASHVFSTFSANNFLGNDRKRPALYLGARLYLNGFNPGPSAHCGVLNVGPLAALFGPAQVSSVPATVIQAPNNYWGSSAGPSSSGPGDNAGGVCDQNHSTTMVKPFSPTKFGGTVTPTVLEN